MRNLPLCIKSEVVRLSLGLDHQAGSHAVGPSASALDHNHPIFPLLGNFHENIAHHRRRGHQSVAFVLENPDLAAPHGLAKPSDVIHRDTRIPTPMVDDNVSCDIHVPEANRLVAFQAHQ